MPGWFRGWWVPVLVATLACAPVASGNPREERTLAALAASRGWLAAHPVAPAGVPLGTYAFDTWSWFLLSAFHPDPGVRAAAGVETDRRLRATVPPADWDLVGASYWAVLARIASVRGVALPSGAPFPEGAALDAMLEPADPTTAFWTETLLRHAGFPTEPDPSGTLLSRGPQAGAGYAPTVADAYAIFHELVPATGLSTVGAELSAEQLAFVRSALPGWYDVCLARSDTDCVAEVLVVAALVGERTPAYDAALDWLLGRAQPDGTFSVPGRGARPDDYRHVVLVGSWALLSALDGFETRVTAR